MKTQKMSLANIQGKLSRAEMKNIMAGSGSGCILTFYVCPDPIFDRCCDSYLECRFDGSTNKWRCGNY